MDYWLHVLARFVIHFMSGTTVLVIFLTLQEWLRRRFWWYPDLKGWAAYVVPSLFAVFAIFLREPADAVRDGALKSYIDFGSWIFAVGAGVYALYRLTPALSRIGAEIQKRKVDAWFKENKNAS